MHTERATPTSGGGRRLCAGLALLAWATWVHGQQLPAQLTLSIPGDPRTTMAIAWTTPRAAPGILSYWREGEPARQSSATSQPLVHSGTRHTVVLRDLAPGSTYRYRIDASEAIFRTAPADASAAVTFVAMGDSRQDVGETDLERWAQVAGAAAQESFDVTLFSGDMVLAGFVPRWWDMWFAAGAPLLAKAPFMATMGNHEMASPAFQRRMPTPGDATWYSFDYGPVHVSVVNTDPSLPVTISPGQFPAPLGPGSAQYSWLEADLSAVPGHMWKVVMLHRLPYSAAEHGDQQDVQALVPLFDSHHVDMVVSGHDHGYQRFLPMAAGAVVPAGTWGTTYVVAAGAGAPLYDVNSADPRLASAAKAFNYVLIHADSTCMTIEAKDAMTGQILDQAVVGVAPQPRPNDLPACATTGG